MEIWANKCSKWIIITVLSILLILPSNMVAYASSLDYLLYRGYMYTGKRSLSDAAIYYSANADSTTVGLNIFDSSLYWYRAQLKISGEFQDGSTYKTIELTNTTDGSTPPYQRWATVTLAGLMPNEKYDVVFTLRTLGNENGSSSGGSDNRTTLELILYTNAELPRGMSFPTIGQSTLKIRWNNGNNPTDSSYTLQRKTDTSSWVNVVTGVNISEFTDTGLIQNTKYTYRVRVNEKRGTYKYSSESWIETATDPAVAAAKAAQSAAESSKAFAEEAKLSAQNAEIRTNDLYDYVTGLDLGNKINNINSKIESLSIPIVIRVSTINGATASSTGQSPSIIVTASGADKLDLSLDGSTWTGGYDLNTGGSIGISPGTNNIRVRVYDSSVPADTRKYAYGNILIFGL